MKIQTLIQWSGPLLIIAAIFLVLFGIHRNVNLYVLGGHTSSLLSMLLFVLSITGVYTAQHQQSGGLGLVAFVLSFIGGLIIFATNLITVAGEKGISGAQAVIDFYDRTLSLSMISVSGFLGGLFLLGLATVRAGVLPRWTGIVLSIGAALVFVGFVALDPLTLFGFLLIGAALAWMGYVLWSSKGSLESQSNSAM